MTKEQLGKGLRSRLAQKCTRGELDRNLPGGRESFLENLKNTSDENLIAGFLKCVVCGRMSMSLQEGVRFTEHCDTGEDWITFLVGWQYKFGGCRHDI